jgi:uncharacterized membrane protein
VLQLVLQRLEAVQQEVRVARILGHSLPTAAARLVAPVFLLLQGPTLVLLRLEEKTVVGPSVVVRILPNSLFLLSETNSLSHS